MVWNSIMVWFLVFASFLCLMAYMSGDPMKSSFFLVMSLLIVSPLIAVNSHIWFAYYVCLLFLSGIFVILVYFASLSNFKYLRRPMIWFILILIMLSNFFVFSHSSFLLGINIFYFDVFFMIFCIIMGVLLFFLNFVNYFLSLGTAVRSL